MQTFSNKRAAHAHGKATFGADNYNVVPRAAGGYVVEQYAPEHPVAEPWPWPVAAQFATQAAAVKGARVLREERNGIKRPLKGVCAMLWQEYDACGHALQITEVRAYAALHNLNQNNASIEFYNWRKFNGLATPRKGA